jgi:hypothetical protein
MPKIKCADKTIFTLRDEGDSSVGISPAELTLTYDWEINPTGFDEILHHLHSLNDGGWHGKVTAYVEYQELQSEAGQVTELKLQVEDYHPDRKPELTVRFI